MAKPQGTTNAPYERDPMDRIEDALNLEATVEVLDIVVDALSKDGAKSCSPLLTLGRDVERDTKRLREVFNAAHHALVAAEGGAQ